MAAIPIYVLNLKRVLPQYAEAYRYGCCIPMSRLTAKQHSAVIIASGRQLGIVTITPTTRRSA